jgi:hypothetical protein
MRAALRILRTVDEELDAGLAIALAQPRVVGRALVAKMRAAGQSWVMGKKRLVGEYGPQDDSRCSGFQRAVELRAQVGGCKMDAPIRCIGTRGDGGRVGGPHARGAATGGKELGGFAAGPGQDLLFASGESQCAQCSDSGSLLRWQDGLFHTHIRQQFHFLQTL